MHTFGGENLFPRGDFTWTRVKRARRWFHFRSPSLESFVVNALDLGGCERDVP